MDLIEKNQKKAHIETLKKPNIDGNLEDNTLGM